MGKKSGNFWANTVGHGLAHIQDGIDDVCGWGFKKMRSVGNEKIPKKKKNESKYLYGAKKVGMGTLSFLGNVGDAFYDKYAELKQDENESSKD